MSFEQLVRPFAARPVIKTSRTVPASVAATAETAILTWGVAGEIPIGVKQEPGVDLETVGFNVESCNQDWQQKGTPEVEEVEKPIVNTSGTEIGNALIDRITRITFSSKKQKQPFSYVAAGVAESIAGLRASIPGFNKCDHSYNFDY